MVYIHHETALLIVHICSPRTHKSTYNREGFEVGCCLTCHRPRERLRTYGGPLLRTSGMYRLHRCPCENRVSNAMN